MARHRVARHPAAPAAAQPAAVQPAAAQTAPVQGAQAAGQPAVPQESGAKKPLIIAGITIGAILLLSVLLFFTQQFVGKAIDIGQLEAGQAGLSAHADAVAPGDSSFVELGVNLDQFEAVVGKFKIEYGAGLNAPTENDIVMNGDLNLVAVESTIDGQEIEVVWAVLPNEDTAEGAAVGLKLAASTNHKLADIHFTAGNAEASADLKIKELWVSDFTTSNNVFAAADLNTDPFSSTITIEAGEDPSVLITDVSSRRNPGDASVADVTITFSVNEFDLDGTPGPGNKVKLSGIADVEYWSDTIQEAVDENNDLIEGTYTHTYEAVADNDPTEENNEQYTITAELLDEDNAHPDAGTEAEDDDSSSKTIACVGGVCGECTADTPNFCTTQAVCEAIEFAWNADTSTCAEADNDPTVTITSPAGGTTGLEGEVTLGFETQNFELENDAEGAKHVQIILTSQNGGGGSNIYLDSEELTRTDDDSTDTASYTYGLMNFPAEETTINVELRTKAGEEHPVVQVNGETVEDSVTVNAANDPRVTIDSLIAAANADNPDQTDVTLTFTVTNFELGVDDSGNHVHINGIGNQLMLGTAGLTAEGHTFTYTFSNVNDGEHTVTVDLRSAGHAEVQVDGALVTASETVTIGDGDDGLPRVVMNSVTQAQNGEQTDVTLTFTITNFDLAADNTGNHVHLAGIGETLQIGTNLLTAVEDAYTYTYSDVADGTYNFQVDIMTAAHVHPDADDDDDPSNDDEADDSDTGTITIGGCADDDACGEGQHCVANACGTCTADALEYCLTQDECELLADHAWNAEDSTCTAIEPIEDEPAPEPAEDEPIAPTIESEVDGNNFEFNIATPETFNTEVTLYTILRDADGAILVIKSERIPDGIDANDGYASTVNYPFPDAVAKKSVILLDKLPDQGATVFASFEE